MSPFGIFTIIKITMNAKGIGQTPQQFDLCSDCADKVFQQVLKLKEDANKT